MASKAKERFEAAVKVIHGLPKNGPFQPSYEMMLCFYSYYKQATEGRCTKPKPWAWDIVNKKKWDAWSSLGDMPQETAMEKYVEELKKQIRSCTEEWDQMSKAGENGRIVEAMPQNEKVREFMTQLGDFYEIVEDVPPFQNQLEENKAEVESYLGILDSTSEESTEDGRQEQDLNHSLILNSMSNQQGLCNGEVSPHEREATLLSHVDEDARLEALRKKSGSGAGEVIQNGREKTESDSEEEFCDTSDQPSLESSHDFLNGNVTNSSTPRDSHKKPHNHVHFSDSLTVHNGAGVYEQSLSPITVSKANSAMLPNGHLRGERTLSDSMEVHTSSTEDTLNLTDSMLMNDNSSASVNASDVFDGSFKGSHPSNSANNWEEEPVCSQRGTTQNKSSHNPDQRSNQALTETLQRLQEDMNRVLTRLQSLEQSQLQSSQRKKETHKQTSRWWPFPQLNGRTFFFILVWPIIVHFILSRVFSRRRHQS